MEQWSLQLQVLIFYISLQKCALKISKRCSKAKRCEIASFLLEPKDFPVENWARSFSLYNVCCVRNTIGSPYSNPRTLGKCFQPTCEDDILKSYGSVESCPSYSQAKMWILHGSCLIAQSCPSWLNKSQREVYLIWCCKRNKQINETLLHNTLIWFSL